jgi:outer membrane protein assembly factor BamB
MIRLFLSGIVLFLLALASHAADWPQFRGPQRDGVSRESGLLAEWPKDGPKLLWTFSDAGVGYSGPAIVGDRLYICGGVGESDVLMALDVKGVKPAQLWSTKIGPLFQWKGNTWNMGPNVTPTVDGDRVYALGGFGDLLCVNAADGKELWRKNMPREFSGEVNPIGGGLEDPTPLGWGYASSPLVDGDKLICVPGGKKGLLAALDKKTGALLWQSTTVTDSAPYASPLVAEIHGVRQYVIVTNKGMVGIAAADGKAVWNYKRGEPFDDVVISSPVVRDNLVFASVGFGQGCDLVRIVPKDGGMTAEKVYGTREMQNRDGGMVLVGDHLYGHSEKGGWLCMDFKAGKVAWAESELMRGSVTAAGGKLVCVAEKGGAVVLVDPSPAGWKEVGRFKLPAESKKRLPSGMLWTHPVVANGKLVIRDQELLFCFDIKQ